MAQIGVELKYITEKLDKVFDHVEKLSSTKTEVDKLKEEVKELKQQQKDLGWLIFVGKYPRLAVLLLIGATVTSITELKSLFGL